ncbi:hypothetical protein SK128_011181 [Halocaridina rubra]|uniref:Uncharacterized protein n=1 Tax=Halocaridina rubra TaxID=373956 RepID=A0AAN8WR34_HALRR
MEMVASTYSSITQQYKSTVEETPTHIPLIDSSTPIHPQFIIVYLGLTTFICLIMSYIINSRWTTSKPEQDETKPVTRMNSTPTPAPGEYIRPLGCMESYLEVGGEYGTLNTVQAIWLASREPINPGDVEKALLLIVQKMPILQVCVEWRMMKPWFKQMKEFAFDFKVEEDEIMNVFYSQLNQPYDMKRGPLWRARLVPIKRENSDDSHRAVFLMSIQHCITDGFTNMQISRNLLEILNNFVTGTVFEIPLSPITPALSDELMTSNDFYYGFKYFWYKVHSTLSSLIDKVPVHNALKLPRTKKALTRILRENFTVEETKIFLQLCKENGVAVHSCLMATASLAVLKTIQNNAKRSIDKARINAVSSVNMRRFFHADFREASGCHISGDEKEVMIHNSSANSKENFWSLVKRFQSNLDDSLHVTQTPIRNSRLLRLYSAIIYVNHEFTRRGLKHVTDSHYSCTNMGNLTSLLPSKYNGPIKITDMLRSGTSEYTGNLFTLVCHTFDNRFMLSLDHYTTKISDEGAAQFFGILCLYIKNLVLYGTVQEPGTSS